MAFPRPSQYLVLYSTLEMTWALTFWNEGMMKKISEKCLQERRAFEWIWTRLWKIIKAQDKHFGSIQSFSSWRVARMIHTKRSSISSIPSNKARRLSLKARSTCGYWKFLPTIKTNFCFGVMIRNHSKLNFEEWSSKYQIVIIDRRLRWRFWIL